MGCIQFGRRDEIIGTAQDLFWKFESDISPQIPSGLKSTDHEVGYNTGVGRPMRLSHSSKMEISLNTETRKTARIHPGLILFFLLVSAVVFASLAEDVVNRESFSTLDPIFGSWLINRTSLTGDRVFSMVTFLGNGLAISVGTGVIGLWFASSKRWDQLIFLFSTVAGAALLNLILKQVFFRPRPEYPQAFLDAAGFSFPSGHAMTSLAFYGAAAYLAFPFLKSKESRLLVAVSALGVSALIGFSRLYLGVHYLTDVLAGWAAGGLWLAACILGDQVQQFSLKQGR